MSTTTAISNLLFKNPTTLPVKCVDMKLGQIGAAGFGISKARKTGDVTGAKLSSVALVLDAIMNGQVSGVEGKNHIYCSYEDKSGNVFNAICTKPYGSEHRVDFLGSSPEFNWENLIPVFLYETRSNADNKELQEILNLVAAKGSTTESVLRMCDSFYYGCAQRKNVLVATGEVSSATVEAAVRSGLLENAHNVLDAFGAPSSPLCKFPSESKSKATTSESSKSASHSTPGAELFDEIRSGKYAISYEWTEEQRKRIPAMKNMDDFVMTEAFRKGFRKIHFRTSKVLERYDMGLSGLDALGKDVVNFFMTGKPGTGKTTVAKALATSFQLPFYSIPIQKGTEEGTFQGLLKARDGKFVFTSTDFLDAFKNGGVIVLEELNLADPAILSGAIGQAIEDPYYVLEDELVPVYRHPLCIIIGTFNVGTAGSKEINPMLSSRFYQTYVVEDPNENEFVDRLMKFDCDKKTAKKIYTAYNRILDYLKSPDVNALEYCKNVTFRGCVGAIQCLQEGATFKEAIEDTLVGKIAEYDLELSRDVLKNVVETLPD